MQYFGGMERLRSEERKIVSRTLRKFLVLLPIGGCSRFIFFKIGIQGRQIIKVFLKCHVFQFVLKYKYHQ